MITVIGRNYYYSLGKSLFIDSGNATGYSYAEGPSDTSLQTLSNGYSGQAWIKPAWDSSAGTPVTFMAVRLNLSPDRYVVLGYDSETTDDAVFVATYTEIDGTGLQAWFYAPVADDVNDPTQYNRSVTNITPSPFGFNSWNADLYPDWVHLAWSVDATFGPQTVPNISSRAKIWWNGTLLKTYDNYGQGNQNSGFNFDEWSQNDPKFVVGSDWFFRDYYADRVGLRMQPSSSADVSGWYNGGSPTGSPANMNLHFNFEDPQNWVSDINPYTLTTLVASGGGAQNPSINSTYFV